MLLNYKKKKLQINLSTVSVLGLKKQKYIVFYYIKYSVIIISKKYYFTFIPLVKRNSSNLSGDPVVNLSLSIAKANSFS